MHMQLALAWQEGIAPGAGAVLGPCRTIHHRHPARASAIDSRPCTLGLK
jgi:hypothetical protein